MTMRWKTLLDKNDGHNRNGVKQRLGFRWVTCVLFNFHDAKKLRELPEPVRLTFFPPAEIWYCTFPHYR